MLFEKIYGKSNVTIDESKIDQYVNEMAKFINEYCDIVNENGQMVMKFKGDPKDKGIQYIKANLWVKPELQHRKYMGLDGSIAKDMRFYKRLNNVNIIESVAIPLDLKNNQNGIYYSARFDFRNDLLILDDEAKVIKNIDAETIINKIKEIKDKEKIDDKKEEEKEKDNFNVDNFINELNSINSGKSGGKKKNKKKNKKKERKERQEREKREKEEQKKQQEEEQKKQQEELNRRIQFQNKWQGLKNKTVKHYNKTQKDIVGELKEYQKRKNAIEKIKNIATKKGKASFKEGLQAIAISGKFIQKQNAENGIKKIAIGCYDKNKTAYIKKIVDGLKFCNYKQTHQNYLKKADFIPPKVSEKSNAVQNYYKEEIDKLNKLHQHDWKKTKNYCLKETRHNLDVNSKPFLPKGGW